MIGVLQRRETEYLGIETYRKTPGNNEPKSEQLKFQVDQLFKLVKSRKSIHGRVSKCLVDTHNRWEKTKKKKKKIMWVIIRNLKPKKK